MEEHFFNAKSAKVLGREFQLFKRLALEFYFSWCCDWNICS